MRTEIDFLFLHISNVGWLSTKLLLHLALHGSTVIDGRRIRSADVGNLFADILANIFRGNTTVITA